MKRTPAVPRVLILLAFGTALLADDCGEDPATKARRFATELQKASAAERDELLLEIERSNLGPEGRPLVPMLVSRLGDDRFRRVWKTLRHEDILAPGMVPGERVHVVDNSYLRIPNLLATFGLEAVDPLTKALDDDSVAVRQNAAYGLGRIGPEAEEAVPALTRMVTEDEDARARCHAAWALLRIGRRTDLSVPALAKALDDEDHDVFLQVCETLRGLGEAALPAIPQLVAAADRHERKMRSFPPGPWVDGFLDNKPMRQIPPHVSKIDELRIASLTAASLLEPEPALAVSRLMRVIRSGPGYRTHDIRYPVCAGGSTCRDAGALAAERLIELGPRAASAVPMLVELVHSGLAWDRESGHDFDDRDDFTTDWLMTSPGLDVLAAIGKPAHSLTRDRVLPLLEKQLGGDDEYDRLWAARDILRVFPGHEEALDEVVDVLRNHEPDPDDVEFDLDLDLRFDAIEVAATVGRNDDRILPALRELAKGPPSPLALTAAATIAVIAPDDAGWRRKVVECLESYYAHEDADLATRDLDSPWEPIPPDVTKDVIARAHSILGEDARPFHPRYVERIGDFDGWSCETKLGDQAWNRPALQLGAKIVPTIIQGIEDPDRWVAGDRFEVDVYGCVRVLGLIGEDAAPAVAILCKTLRTGERPHLRSAAAEALGRIAARPDEAVPALTAALDDPRAEVRAAAAVALRAFGDDARAALPKLRALAKSEYVTVHEPARTTISALGEE